MIGSGLLRAVIGWLHVFTSSSDWSNDLFVSVVIGQKNDFYDTVENVS